MIKSWHWHNRMLHINLKNGESMKKYGVPRSEIKNTVFRVLKEIKNG